MLHLFLIMDVVHQRKEGFNTYAGCGSWCGSGLYLQPSFTHTRPAFYGFRCNAYHIKQICRYIMQLALNLIFRILPFPKGKLFFTLRFLLFQCTSILVALAVVLFIIVQRKIALNIQCLFILSLYILYNPPRKNFVRTRAFIQAIISIIVFFLLFLSIQ